MTDKIEDGGPAFPRAPFDVNDYTGDGSPGMTLRDWFAGQALMGFLAYPDTGNWAREENLATICYGYAEAMLAARVRK